MPLARDYKDLAATVPSFVTLGIIPPSLRRLARK